MTDDARTVAIDEKAIFFAALDAGIDRAPPEQRRPWIAEACGRDMVARQRVEALLAAHGAAATFLERPILMDDSDLFDGRLLPNSDIFGREFFNGEIAGGKDLGGENLGGENLGGEIPGVPIRKAAGLAAASSVIGHSATHNRLGDPAAPSPELAKSSAGKLQPALQKLLHPSEEPDSLGRIGHYEILSLLGQGGMGAVFLARDRKLQRLAAVKVLAPVLAANETARKRFLREAQAQAQISHPNVAAIFAVEEDEVPYLVMEYVPGQTLLQYVTQHGPLPLDEILRIGRQAAAGLAAAHALGLIHRDIKPGNILLKTGTLEAKVADFGLARAKDDVTVTSPGEISGSPPFMSPEQAQGDPVDHRGDLFSLGSVLYTMCTGRLPFEGDSPWPVMRRVIEDAPPPICEFNPAIPGWLCDVIGKLHAKRPEDRYASADEVAAVLARGLESPAPTPADGPAIDGSALPDVAVLGVGLRADEDGLVSPQRAAPSAPMATPSPLFRRMAASPRGRAYSLGALLALIALVAGMILIRLPQGDLVIETDDPAFAFRVAGERVLLDDREAGRSYELQIVQADPERQVYELAVNERLSGLGFQAPTFTIRRGERVALRASIRPPTANDQPVVETPPSGEAAAAGAPPVAAATPKPSEAPPLAVAPFDAQAAREHQRAWAEYLGLPVEYVNSVQMRLRLIPPGEYVMGTTDDELRQLRMEAARPPVIGWYLDRLQRQLPARRVRISQPFYLSVTEVTQAESRAVAGFPLADDDPRAGLPAVLAVWSDAADFCNRLSLREELNEAHEAGDATLIAAADGYRLPTEAQWEWACRAGSTTRWWWGDASGPLVDAAWFDITAEGQLQPVGVLRPNPFGLHDMLGNAWEWCYDWFEHVESDEPLRIDPLGPPAGIDRVLRGGCYRDPVVATRIAFRIGNHPGIRNDMNGFRVVLPIEGVRARLNAERQ